jgi:hypothetical protein
LAKNVKKILVAGKHADDIGYQCGGWTIAWHGDSGKITPGKYKLRFAKKKIVPIVQSRCNCSSRSKSGATTTPLFFMVNRWKELFKEDLSVLVYRADLSLKILIENCLSNLLIWIGLNCCRKVTLSLNTWIFFLLAFLFINHGYGII